MKYTALIVLLACLVGYGAERKGVLPPRLWLPSRLADQVYPIQADEWIAGDGDTIIHQDGTKIRLVGIDTPERGIDGSTAATNFLSALLPSVGTVKICHQQSRGKYGRLLGWLQSKHQDVNLAMVKAGHARTFMIPPCGVTLADQYHAAMTTAINGTIGLWQSAPILDACADDLAMFTNRFVTVRGSVRLVRRAQKKLTIELVSVENSAAKKRECVRAIVLDSSLRAGLVADDGSVWPAYGESIATAWMPAKTQIEIVGKLRFNKRYEMLLGHPRELKRYD